MKYFKVTWSILRETKVILKLLESHSENSVPKEKDASDKFQSVSRLIVFQFISEEKKSNAGRWELAEIWFFNEESS